MVKFDENPIVLWHLCRLQLEYVATLRRQWI